MKKFYRILGILSSSCAVLLFLLFTFGIAKWVIFPEGLARQDQVAILNVNGVIWQSTPLLKELDELAKDSAVKAIVVRVNSPGGLVAPSQEIYSALLKVDAKKPVVISMGAVAASGGYYIAMGGRKIFANPGTLTASIGVIMEFVNTEKLLQWAKVERYTLKSGKFKDTGASFRAMKPEEKELLNTVLLDIHKEFRGVVRKRRKLDDALMAQATDGRVATGSQALQLKLVDAIGGLDDAIKEAKGLAGLAEDAHVRYPEEKEGLVEQLLFGEARGILSSLAGFIAGPENLPSSHWLPGWQVMLLAPVK